MLGAFSAFLFRHPSFLKYYSDENSMMSSESLVSGIWYFVLPVCKVEVRLN